MTTNTPPSALDAAEARLRELAALHEPCRWFGPGRDGDLHSDHDIVEAIFGDDDLAEKFVAFARYWASRYVDDVTALRAQLAEARAEVASWKANSESWRIVHNAWQDWAKGLLDEYGQQLPNGIHGDEPAREIIAKLASMAKVAAGWEPTAWDPDNATVLRADAIFHEAEIAVHSVTHLCTMLRAARESLGVTELQAQVAALLAEQEEVARPWELPEGTKLCSARLDAILTRKSVAGPFSAPPDLAWYDLPPYLNLTALLAAARLRAPVEVK